MDEVPPGARLNREALFRRLGYVPHPGQQRVHDSRAPRRVLAAGVRWGKSRCAAMESLAALMEPKLNTIGWVVAPTYDLATRVFNQIGITASSQLQHRVVKLSESDHRLVLRNLGGGLSEVRAKSADNPVSLLGEGLDFVIVDEAARLRPDIWNNYVSQRLIDKQGWALLISTPRGKGHFYELWRRGQAIGGAKDPDYETWSAPSWENPILDRALIEAERERLPARVFSQEYGAEFLEGSGAVFRNVRECAKGEFAEPDPKQSYFAGLDLAKIEDFTVLVIMNRKSEVVFVDRFHRIDWALQVSRVKAALDRFNGARVLVDSTGKGEPVFETLSREGVRCVEYPFTAKSKSDLVNHLALLLERQKLVLPKAELWPEGIEELESFQYSVTDSGNVRTGAPSGVHDDCVIALGLAAWCLKEHSVVYRMYPLPSPFSRAPASTRDIRRRFGLSPKARVFRL